MFRALTLAVSALLLSTAAAPAPSGGDWRSEPAFVRLFTPAHPPGAYEAYVSAVPLEQVLRQVSADPALLHPPGSWIPIATTPIDAFGRLGRYNPWALARLYGSRRPLVARGPRGRGGRVVESWTLISPYPDLSFTRLEPGTLLLVVRVP